MVILNFFDIINDFAQKELMIDWSNAWNNDEYLISLFKGIDSIQQSIALLPDLPQLQRIELLGNLSFIATRMDFAATIADDYEEFMRSCQELETILRKIVALPNWATLARQRTQTFEELFEKTEKEGTEPTPAELLFFQPIFLALALSSVIRFDEEQQSIDAEDESPEEEEEDCCSSDEECLSA